MEDGGEDCWEKSDDHCLPTILDHCSPSFIRTIKKIMDRMPEFSSAWFSQNCTKEDLRFVAQGYSGLGGRPIFKSVQ
jgi:hypothetical protein